MLEDYQVNLSGFISPYRGNIYVRFFSNSEEKASELLVDFE